MDWFSLALIGTITTAVANIIDKYLLEKRIRNLYIPVIVDGLLAAVFVLALWFTFPIQSISAELLFWNLVSGALFTYVLIFYFKAVQSDDVSRIIPLFNLLPLFVVVVSVIFFGYVFETFHYAGIILLFGGACLASVKDIESPRLSKGLLLALAVVVIGGSNTLLLEHLLQEMDFVSVYFYSRIGGFLAAIPLLVWHRKDFAETIRFPQKRGLVFILISETLALAALLFFTQAVSLEKAALVSSISYTQPIVVLLMSIFLSVFFPTIIKESMEKKELLLKVLAVMMVTAGAILLAG